jgi:pimeloyl-ACP methyl ester carboxylesterase
VRCFGSPSAPIIVCVHGFPDSSELWDGVVALLASRFRVVVYDVRGTGSSSAPPRRRASYRLERLEDDFVAVLDAVAGERPVHVLAHDWGSIQAWHFLTGSRVRGRVASYVSVSGPCLDHAGYFLRNGSARSVLRQAAHSWYVYLFQLPWLPELGFRTGWSQRVLRRRAPDVGTVALRDCVNGLWLYRANIVRRLWRPAPRCTDVPVLVVAPRSDPYVLTPLQASAGRWASDLRVEVVDGGHWLPRSSPSVVAELTAGHINRVAAHR